MRLLRCALRLQFLRVLSERGAAPGSSGVLSPRAGAMGALAGQGAWIPGDLVIPVPTSPLWVSQGESVAGWKS